MKIILNINIIKQSNVMLELVLVKINLFDKNVFKYIMKWLVFICFYFVLILIVSFHVYYDRILWLISFFYMFYSTMTNTLDLTTVDISKINLII